MYLVTWRVGSYDQVPETLRSWIETNAPLWRAPPVDLDQVRDLQQAE